MRDIPVKSTGDTLTASEFNDIPGELENIITDTSQTLTAADLHQLSKATAIYASYGDFYSETGVADAYVTSPAGSKKAPEAYAEGMRVRFKPANTNTGASTINVNSIGVKNIKDQSGVDPISGAIDANKFLEVTFDAANDYFVISGLLTEAEIKEIAQKGDYAYEDKTTGSGTAYLVTLAPAPAAYTGGLRFIARIDDTNTITNPTMNVNGLGNKQIRNIYGEVLAIGDLQKNMNIEFVYDTTDGRFYAQTYGIATQTESGIVVQATNAEVTTGTDTEKYITPAGLASRQGSEILSGLLELANKTEFRAGVDATKPISTARLVSDLADSSNGYWILPGGWKIQWGTSGAISTGSADGSVVVTFPTAFTTAVFSVVGTADNNPNPSWTPIAVHHNPITLTTVKFIADSTDAGQNITNTICIKWIAIGK